MRPASQTSLWTGIPQERRIGPGTRIGWAFFKVFATIKRNYRKNATPSNRAILVWSRVKSLFPEYVTSVTDRSLNGHEWGTADWPEYPHWLNVLQGICNNKRYYQENATTSNRVTLVWSWVKSLFRENAASVTDRSLNGHKLGTADLPEYPHWLNVQGFCDNTT